MKAKQMPACGNPDCGVSTGICGAITFGSGELDENGYWEDPCVACAAAWRDWEVDEDTEEISVWPHPPPRLTFDQMVKVLQLPIGGPCARDEDDLVKQERRRLKGMYARLRTTNNRVRSDKKVLSDIAQATQEARRQWLEEQFKLRGCSE